MQMLKKIVYRYLFLINISSEKYLFYICIREDFISLLATICDFVERYCIFHHVARMGAVFHLRDSSFAVYAVYRYARTVGCIYFLCAHHDVELYTSIIVFILSLSLFLTCICLRAGSAQVLTCLEFIRESTRTHCTHGKAYRYFCCLFPCYLTCASAVGSRTVGHG